MLNRTNRTLSANLNRLNLGTRSLAVSAGVNNGDQTLRIRHTHRVVMRDGMTWFRPSPISISRGEIPVIPGSPSVSPPPVPGCVVRVRVGLAVETPSVANRLRWHGESQGPSPASDPRRQRPEREKSSRKPFTGKRWDSGNGLGVPARAARATAAACYYAASGG